MCSTYTLSISLSHHLDLFLLLFRRQPTSTLFPYTTLFRSRRGGHRRRRRTGRQAGRGPVSEFRPRQCCQPADVAEDRKSTRLNSSHANISYAVFCLKKKKSYINTILLYINL